MGGQAEQFAPVCLVVVAAVGTGTDFAAAVCWLVVVVVDVVQQPGRHERHSSAGRQLPGAEPEPAG